MKWVIRVGVALAVAGGVYLVRLIFSLVFGRGPL